ncbi:DotU family type VI secretion system protein [Caldimonas thermodepolymerans]|jgi:type VI secretion system OmpA/MotB family protein|uniref:Type VI secretion system protein ImpK n=1 Tax=Caldimonas thermodepolymerans TaxID=215580 RepID=A0A2S5T7G0_9BURK|nr:DotU family type VI secretion system protein [Caldimonas thermodepolymerans]PPE70797.1 type VI secretion system protein TssL [Caldimonas thermodepolymerans]QPC33015.1 DotU family type VI secretion system protein [Caldimonas thermodepolymerans]RDI03801.1 type VI secretion system protein ImpK [Caldimonas thermodepolymerans]TCP09768.1 type VI secretion system protein ImpK [Caldimonas thermodepolymerans]UZG45884.1 DotU family type VI secretion system protein [Caldimonas thermodepolymerans]
MSPSQDPFAGFDAGQTFVMPTPGARPTVAAPAGLHGFNREPAQDIAYHPSGFNPLIAAANPLLNLIPQMRTITVHQDVAGLRDNLAQGIRQFEQAARAAGIANEKVIAARYILCTVLDETAASTPWGGSGVWGRHSLLVMFHNEAWGGEKVFQLLTRLAQNPGDNLDLLELIYTCITLGFEGRYRVIENGRSELQVLRERLAQLIRRQRGNYEPALSQHWAPAVLPKRKWSTAMPLWIFSAVVGIVLVAGYTGFSYALNRSSDPLFSSITAIKARPMQLPAPVPAQRPRLAQFLAPEIQQGLVEVRDFDDRSIVTLRGDGLFAPGSATLAEEREPLMLRIADALNSVQGKVLVTGHTDNVPIRSARFPSNWHLSQERARSVAALLSRKITQPQRLLAEGRAESEPVAPNDTPANRAKNRRVEITVFVSQQAG